MSRWVPVIVVTLAAVAMVIYALMPASAPAPEVSLVRTPARAPTLPVVAEPEPPPGPAVSAPAPPPPAPVEDGEDEPPGAVKIDDLKASVRAFYATLPEGWRMPPKIRVDEVLPPKAIEVLGVPPESLLDEISHYPLNMKTGLEIVMELDPATTDGVGVAIILPSGRRYLDELPLVP